MTSLQQQQQQQTWSQQLSKDVNTAPADNNEETSSSSAPPVRKRTRATADQLSVLEDTFAVNVSPNSKLRKQLAEQLQMSERSIQIWFQNRRAKVKHMQKRAQMQMHQASIRAQLYQFHQQQQQQQQPFGHHQPLLPMQPYQHPYYYNRIAGPPARAQSVDAVQHHHYHNNNTRIPSQQQPQQQQQQDMLFTPASSVPPVIQPHHSYTPPPYPQYYGQSNWMPLQEDMPLSRQSMPPQVYPYQFNHSVDPSLTGLDFPEYVHGQVSPSPSPLHQKSNSAIPTLVSVPDAGPTVILATANATPQQSSPSPPRTSSYSSSPDAVRQQQPAVSTIDPSNLMMNSPTPEQETDKTSEKTTSPAAEVLVENADEEPKDLYLSATTLTIGTWHRLKMHDTDLVCVYRPDTRTFAWHIVDGGCHFKMEVAQHAVSSIEMVLDEHEALSDVHFDISEPPLFYMESTTPVVAIDEKKKTPKNTTEELPQQTSPMWVQCSDFTEGKQASRFFRHTLKGVAHHMKQELLTLINNHEETRRLVQFIEPQYTQTPSQAPPSQPQQPAFNSFTPLLEQPQQDQLLIQAAAAGFMNPNAMYWPNQEPIPCELYMS